MDETVYSGRLEVGMKPVKVGKFEIVLVDGDRSSYAWTAEVYIDGHRLDVYFPNKSWKAALAAATRWCQSHA